MHLPPFFLFFIFIYCFILFRCWYWSRCAHWTLVDHCWPHAYHEKTGFSLMCSFFSPLFFTIPVKYTIKLHKNGIKKTPDLALSFFYEEKREYS